MNMNMLTEFEEHTANQETFKQIMPILSKLDAEELEILTHLIKSKSRDINKAS
jgi:hypothetical protein